ncbi:hypothetical protein M413DRAFT_30517 [Hebeloma cylindrosporum]|uniref:F-box domain-containing protein n=1 Tax=Hebeloma cylindrosporum TaxID=76867 RepID=A0A0C3BMA8_HEBCY|nr:hypothetical protein M413DRAFT_30517 [Hebeloma cylindrosporum h7]
MAGGVDTNTSVGGDSPINKVPPEILAHIFEAGMVWKQSGFSPENPFFPNCHIYGDAPMIYLRVCRYWREVALSTSSLWTSCSSDQFWGKVAIAPAMKFWLDRSSPTAPLNLQLRFQPNFSPLYANNIFRLLATEAKRWRSMSIELDLSLAQEFVTLLCERIQDLSQLESLEICLQSFPKGIPTTISQRILAQISLLKSLRCFIWVANGHRNRDHAFCRLQVLGVLDEITLSIPSLFDECVGRLSQCVSATKVSIYDRARHYHPFQSKPVLPMTTLPRLTSLTLDRCHDALNVLDFFTLPSLEYLKIRTECEDHAGHNLTILHDFLERSKCALRLLAISGKLTSSFLTDYLLFSPIRSIPEVHITSPLVATVAIKILEMYPDAENIFPPLLCWIPNESLPCSRIGWRNLAIGEKLIYSWTAGKLELTDDKYILDRYIYKYTVHA